MTKISHIRLSALTLALCVLSPGGLHGQSALEPSERANASLRPYTVFEGQRAVLQIDIPHHLAIEYPEPPAIDGANIEFFQTARRRIGDEIRQAFYYEVRPERPGTLEIPPFAIPTNRDQALHTKPQTLRVRPLSDLPDLNPEKRPLFAAINIPNTQPYANQRQPMEIMIIARDDLTVTRVEFPEIDAEGWAMERFGENIENTFIWEGRRYNTISYQTFFSPLRSGKLTIGPARVLCQVRVLEEGEGNFPFPTTRVHNLAARSQPVELEVRPLPTDPPEGFAGAVGQFNMSVDLEARPSRPSDPLTIAQRIEGHGDFTQVQAPEPIDAEAWKIIELSASQPTRPMQPQPGGERNFRFLLRPTGVTTQTPAFRFVYFDPVAEEYKTLLSDPIEIPQTEPSTTREAGTPPPGTERTPPTANDQIVTTLPPSPPEWQSPQPSSTTSLWQAHASAAAALALLLTAGLFKRWKTSPSGIRARARAKLRQRLQRIVKSLQSNPTESLHALMQWIEDWQHSPLARPLRNEEAQTIAVLRDIHHARRYASNPREIATHTLDNVSSLRSLLR